MKVKITLEVDLESTSVLTKPKVMLQDLQRFIELFPVNEQIHNTCISNWKILEIKEKE